jgi:uncharacterized protein YicC (UPF0701 family)
MAKEVIGYYSKLRESKNEQKHGSGFRMMMVVTSLEHIKDMVSNDTAARAIDRCRSDIKELALKKKEGNATKEYIENQLDAIEKRVYSFSQVIDVERQSRKRFEKHKLDEDKIIS